MNVATMRLADRWAGVPACLLLTVVRRLADALRSKRRRLSRPVRRVLTRRAGLQARQGFSQPVRRVLVVKLAEQGATVLAYAAIRRAVEMVGRENVYFFVFEENRFILDAMGVIPPENVIAIPTGGILKTVLGLLAGLRKVRRIGVDAVVDLEFFARSSAVICYLSGAAVRVGLHRHDDPAPYRGDLMTHRVAYDPKLHTSRAFLLMVEAMFQPAENLPGLLQRLPVVVEACPPFVPTGEELARVRSKLEQAAGGGELAPLVLLNANASDLIPLRRWPTECYVALAGRLLERYPSLRIAFTGAPDERPKLEPVLERIGSDRCFSMAGRTTLRELLVLYHLADVLVTNDSGPAHFAALTPIEALTLFGPETPALFGAETPRSHIIWRGLPCSPCVSAYNNRLSRCRNNRCMLEIGVDEVFEKVCELVEKCLSSGKTE